MSTPDKPPDGSDTIVERSRTRLGVGEVRRAPPTELVGQIVHGYLVEAELGSGAMGTVYRASHVETHRTVAIKALHPEHLHERQIVERFKREAQLAARLSHPNVAGVLEVGTAIEDGRHLIVMEYVDGEPLSAKLVMPLAPERVAELTRQLLLGLAHAHEAGLVHRDLKPDNIIVEWRDGHEIVRIVDFGIAVLRDPDESAPQKLTATGQMIGTPIYMSPEQAKCDPLDHRSDLFALGVIMYEMLTGKLPFEGSAIEVALANIHKDPPAIATRAPGVLVEPLLEAFCRKLMARSLDRRFASAHAALDVLALIASDPDEARPALGMMNVARALAVVSLPDPP